jgi:hypothetical protein
MMVMVTQKFFLKVKEREVDRQPARRSYRGGPILIKKSFVKVF